MTNKLPVVVIGAGFTGLSCAYELSRQGIPVVVLEKDEDLGGLAASFKIADQRLEKFYHHWFNNDEHILQLIKELHLENQLDFSSTRTGVYINKKFFNLSKPLDVLRFEPLRLKDRIRLGKLVLRARRVKDWKKLESITAQEWLIKLCGPEVYRVVWEPLLRGKFGVCASEISAVWFWNKLVLRGGSRNKMGEETLVYYRGSFSALAKKLAEEIESAGGEIKTSLAGEKLDIQNGSIKGVITPEGTINAQAVVATPALPIIADMLGNNTTSQYRDSLKKIKYLANVCVVLELSRSLSSIYWLNVNDPEFPFIGVIEHTNFQPPDSCADRHIIYLSQYLEETSELYNMDKERIFEFAVSHIKRMFPEFDRSWIYRYHTWKARYAQPVVTCHYSKLIPANETPIKGLYIASMAQIYPEDRGTNYAVREGRRIGKMLATKLRQGKFAR